MKKKIAVVDLLFNWPPDGGARTDIKEIMTRLNGEFDVKLFAPEMDYGFNRGRNAETLGIDTVKIKSDPFDFNCITFAEKLKNKIDEFKPDLIFFGDGWFMKPAVIPHFKNYKYIIRFYAYEGLCLRQHGVFFKNNKLCEKNYLEGGLREWAECSFCAIEWLIKSRAKVFIQEYLGSLAFLPSYKNKVVESFSNASAIICYNDFIKQKLIQFSKNTHIVPSGINLQSFDYSSNKLEDLKTKKSINLLMVGRASDPAKGYKILYDAYKILIKKYPNVTLTVTAEPWFDVKDKNIKIVNWVTQEKLPELYKNADICIIPSIWPEPFGIVTLEAMASGVPVIVSDSVGPSSVIKDNITGLIYKKLDSRDLADKIEIYINNNELYNSSKKNAYNDVADYTWDKVYKKILRIFWGLINYC